MNERKWDGETERELDGQRLHIPVVSSFVRRHTDTSTLNTVRGDVVLWMAGGTRGHRGRRGRRRETLIYENFVDFSRGR